MAGWDMGVELEDVWEFTGQFYRGTLQSQGILYNPMGHRGLMGLMGSLMANLDMTGARIEAIQKHARYAEGLGMRLHTHTHTR